MKVRLIRDMRIRNSHYDPLKEKRCKQQGLPYPEPKYVWVHAGHELDHEKSWKLIYMGVAEPADAEAEAHVEANGFDQSKFSKAIWHYTRAEKGIVPEDFEHYKAGLMDGYDAEGNPTLNGKPVTLPEDDDYEEF
ncbi:MAG: hypothetical protein HUJ26_18990 [Planctomycetaceae bacterium]|nr:hypothetical protein [Planctomycetaceae bacterium]